MERGLVRSSGRRTLLACRVPGSAILSAVVGVTLLASPVAFGGTPPPIWTSASTGWSNGVVACTFAPDRPGMTAAAAGASASGLYVGLTTLEELSPNGSTIALASAASASWTIMNDSRPGLFQLSYSASAPEISENGSTLPLGAVNVNVSFALDAYHGAPASEQQAVTMRASITNWTWLGPRDALAMTLVAWPALHSSEHLVAGPGSTVESVTNASGQASEFLAPNVTAVVQYGTGVTNTVAVRSTLALALGRGTVRAVFGPTAGMFQSLEYSAIVGLAPENVVLAIPWYAYVAVVGTAAAASAIIAYGVRVVRHSPSAIVYEPEDLTSGGRDPRARTGSPDQGGPD